MSSKNTDYLGLAYFKGQWKYFQTYTPVKKGENRGKLCVSLFGSGGRKLVRPDQIKRLPTAKGEQKLFK